MQNFESNIMVAVRIRPLTQKEQLTTPDLTRVEDNLIVLNECRSFTTPWIYRSRTRTRSTWTYCIGAKNSATPSTRYSKTPPMSMFTGKGRIRDNMGESECNMCINSLYFIVFVVQVTIYFSFCIQKVLKLNTLLKVLNLM